MMYTFKDLINAVSDSCNPERTLEIIRSGIEVDSQNEAACTALMFAVMPNEYGDNNSTNGIHQIVKVLLSAGARIDAVDSSGLSAYDYCQQLLDPQYVDKFGDSALDSWTEDDIAVINSVLDLLSHPKQ